LKKYKKKYEKIGIMKELRSRQAFEKPSITRRMEIKRAAYRSFVQNQEGN
jgi:small subunit ribosomal protein S21